MPQHRAARAALAELIGQPAGFNRSVNGALMAAGHLGRVRQPDSRHPLPPCTRRACASRARWTRGTSAQRLRQWCNGCNGGCARCYGSGVAAGKLGVDAAQCGPTDRPSTSWAMSRIEMAALAIAAVLAAVAVWMAVDCLVRLVRRAFRRWRRAVAGPERSLLDLIGAASPPEGTVRK